MGIYKHEINNISKFELKKLSEFLKDDLGIKNKAEIKEKNNDGSYKAIIKMDSKMRNQLTAEDVDSFMLFEDNLWLEKRNLHFPARRSYCSVSL